MRNIVKLKTAYLYLSLLFCGSVWADFQINLDQQAVYKKFGMYVLDDLGIGESAYIHQGSFCIDKSGKFKIPIDTEVVSDRSEYGSYFKVKRLPSDKLSITLIPAKSETKNDEITGFIKKMVNKKQAFQCKLLHIYFGYPTNDFFHVISVEGESSLKGLLDKMP